MAWICDSAQLVCEATHPCALAIDVVELLHERGGTSLRPVGGGIELCVHGTANCAETSWETPGSVTLHHLPPGDVMVTVHGAVGKTTFVDQTVRLPVIYRTQKNIRVVVGAAQ